MTNEEWTEKWNACIKVMFDIMNMYKAGSIENATNGDVIKAVRKPYKISIGEPYVQVYLTEHDFVNRKRWEVFTVDWWNAPCTVEKIGKYLL